MRIPVYVVVGTDPQTGSVNPILCNEDEQIAKTAMDEMIDALELSSMTLPANLREEVAQTCNTFRIVDGILEIADNA